MSRVLAVDPGTKHVGLALSDPTGTVATPLAPLPAAPGETLVERLAAAAREHEAARLIVGLPRNMDGSLGEAGRAARLLAQQLQKATRLPVDLVDERLSSVAAERALIGGGVRRARRKELSHGVAAAIILEGWLQSEAGRRG
ncbi:MAG TPA: Holliday junction resolvase RuvX [Candidatus Dormibacteraeota bacterium]